MLHPFTPPRTAAPSPGCSFCPARAVSHFSFYTHLQSRLIYEAFSEPPWAEFNTSSSVLLRSLTHASILMPILLLNCLHVCPPTRLNTSQMLYLSLYPQCLAHKRCPINAHEIHDRSLLGGLQAAGHFLPMPRFPRQSWPPPLRNSAARCPLPAARCERMVAAERFGP